VLDGNGNRLETLLAGGGSIVRTFDERDRLRSRHETVSSETVTSDWWPGGLLKTLGYPGVATPVAYAYDRRGRLQTVTDWLGAHTTYTWSETGQLASATLPGGIVAQWTFDDAGRLIDTLTAASDGTVLAHAGFTLDGAGRPKGIDWLLALAPDRPSAATKTMTYNGDRLQNVDGQAVGYDSDGNATALPGGPALGYDAFNRLSTVAGTQLTYDADGLRRTFLLKGVALRATWSGGEYADFYANLGDGARAVGGAQAATTPTGAQLGLPLCGQPPQAQSLDDALPRLLALSDAAGAVQARYVYGVGLIETIGADGSARVHVHDPCGSTLALADPAAAGALPSDCYAYDPFGNPLLAVGTSQNPFRLHGQWGVADAAGGPLAMGARDYAPGVLRFLQRDPLFGEQSAPQTLNRYAFLAGNPLQAIDPFGYASARAQDKNPGGGEGDALARGLVIGLGVATGLLLAAGAGAGLLGAGSLGAAGAGAGAGGVGAAAGGVEGAGALTAGEGTVAADAAAADVELGEFTAGRPSAGSAANEPLLDRGVVRSGEGWELRRRFVGNVSRTQPPRAAPTGNGGHLHGE
jgi:RHS repeat-associated protein